jgi:hypothetical protein
VGARSLSGAGALLVLVMALLLPSSVQGEEARQPPTTVFRLQASNGYELFGFAVAPAEGDEGEIALYLSRGKREAAIYYSPATVSRTAVEADLGKLGRISVKRVRTGRTKTVRRGCHSKKRKRIEVERYEGTIEFHGEEGFTDVSATSAPLERATFCVAEEGGRPPGKTLPGARLDVDKNLFDKYRLEFDAVQPRPGSRTVVSAEVDEHRGEIGIYRVTWTVAGAAALHFDRHLRSATVRPPAPFAGHGTFHADAPRARRWTGNLTVDFPGRADVPITGPGFSADLAHPRR